MTKPFDLPAFKAFVEGKDPNERYDGCDWHACALAQFGFEVRYVDLRRYAIPVAVYEAAVRGKHQFGALAERLNKLGEVEQ